jgi:hypothetical protein
MPPWQTATDSSPGRRLRLRNVGLSSEPYANALPAAQLHWLASLPWALADASYAIYTVFFGLDILCLSYLLFRSRFVPRAIAMLLAIDGLAYLI